jgi:hypothetical protein
MLKLEDFKINEIETLETIIGGDFPIQQCLDMTYRYKSFLGWVYESGSGGDIHDE